MTLLDKLLAAKSTSNILLSKYAHEPGVLKFTHLIIYWKQYVPSHYELCLSLA